MNNTRRSEGEAYEEYIPCELSVYEYLVEKTKDFGELTALKYFGRTFSYRELQEKINEAERALRSFGIVKGDIVSVSLPGMPEAVFILYAISKIGACYCAFDCRSKQPEISEMLNTFRPKLCVVPSFQMAEFKNIENVSVLYISPTESLGLLPKLGSLFASLFTGRSLLALNRKFLSYNALLKKAKTAESLPPEKNGENIFGYFYTSGTTYGRKSIILTNENINAAAYQLFFTLEDRAPGRSILNIMPLFTCYGVTVALHFPLSSGVAVNLVPLVNTKKLKALFLREKPDYVVTVPAHWEHFVKESFKNCDLSFLKKAIVGGDKIDWSYKLKINGIFKECGSDGYLCHGYGLSETASIGVCPNRSTPINSNGKALKCTRICIFDRDTAEPLPPGREGEICISGPTLCLGYFGDAELTERLLRRHSDGRLWLHTGDIGFLDDEGNLYFWERIKRMYVRYDGTKVSPFSIEEALVRCSAVKRCMVVAVPDLEHEYGMCAKALIVPNEKYKKRRALQEIKKFIRENLGEHMQPKELRLVKSLPYTKNGKLDYFGKIK